jgi:cellulase
MTVKSVCTLVAAFAAGVLAHGTVPNFKTDGTSQGGFLLDYYYMIQNGQTPPKVAGWYAENLDIGFVEPNKYGTADIICHKNSKPGEATAKVKAGGTVDFLWTDWPHGYGPVLTYVAKCSGSCTTVDKTSLRWVKIDEAGINYDTQKWASQDLIDRNNTWTTTVPASLAPGQYVFRHEIIALHGAASANGAQNYPQCFNIEVTGSGTANPTGVAATSFYYATDPGILMNPYTTITDYKIPGPALWSGAKTKRDHARDMAM